MARGRFQVGVTVSNGKGKRPMKAAGKGGPHRIFSLNRDGTVPAVFRKRVFQRAVR